MRSYPGLDEHQYVTQQSALTRIDPIARAIERGGGPYPVRIDVGPYPRRDDIGPWGLDLRLNGTAVGAARRFLVFAHGTPAQRAAARWLISDGMQRRCRRPGPATASSSASRAATAAPSCASTSAPARRRKPTTARLPTGSGNESRAQGARARAPATSAPLTPRGTGASLSQ